MTENDDLVRVFTGSVVEANYIKSLLEEAGIGAIVRNTLNESLVAGWASGAPGDAGLVFVAEEHRQEALKLIDEYSSNKK